MNCPHCGCEMREGRVSVEAPVLSHAHAARYHLCFHGEADDERVTPDLDGCGFHCPSCDTVVATGRWTEALVCLQCGEVIPARADVCQSCGWSWK